MDRDQRPKPDSPTVITGYSRGPRLDSPVGRYEGTIKGKTIVDFTCVTPDGAIRYENGMCNILGKPSEPCAIVSFYKPREEQRTLWRCRTRAGVIVKDNEGRVLVNDEDPLDLTDTEFSFLSSLMRRNGGIATPEELMSERHAYMEEKKKSSKKVTFTYLPERDDMTAKMSIARLRRKLGQVGRKGFIETVYGEGYRIDILDIPSKVSIRLGAGILEVDRLTGEFYSSYLRDGKQEGFLIRTQGLPLLELIDQREHVVSYSKLINSYKRQVSGNRSEKETLRKNIERLEIKLGLKKGKYIKVVDGEGYKLVTQDVE